MQIIPVIDVLDNQVVHARRGQREHYRPLRSCLTDSTRPDRVIDALLRFYPFPVIYLADLNALTERPATTDWLQAVLARYPRQRFWLDAGFQDYPALTDQVTPILATESWPRPELPVRQPFILSLDFMGDRRIGQARVFDRPEQWPETLIMMNLAQVGSEQGPDMTRLRAYRQRFPEHRWVAAGGVRGPEDLFALARLGIDRALVATALYTGKLERDTLMTLAQNAKNR